MGQVYHHAQAVHFFYYFLQGQLDLGEREDVFKYLWETHRGGEEMREGPVLTSPKLVNPLMLV